MKIIPRKLSKTFENFFDSEKSGGFVLIFCTVVSLAVTNSVLGANYLSFWQTSVAGLSLGHWINDGLMAIFFLLIGLELVVVNFAWSGTLNGRRKCLREIVEAFALGVQASLMKRFGDADAAEAFCATRLEGDWAPTFGTLPPAARAVSVALGDEAGA